MDKGLWVYDLEAFSNFFSAAFLNTVTKEKRIFVCYKTRNELPELLTFLRDKKLVKGLIGFNNVGFDYPILHLLLTKEYRFKKLSGREIAEAMKAKVQEVIENEYSSIRKASVVIPQLDLYLIHHMNNRAKACGLKWVEFAMRWEKLQDLPYEPNHVVEDHQVDEIVDYNWNDVDATFELYKASQSKIDLRKKISKKYNLELINANDPKIGSEIFAKILCERKGLTWNQLRDMRTERDEIELSECILPYVKFDNPEFKALLSFLKRQTITETKGFFSDIPIKDCKEIVPYIPGNNFKKSGAILKLSIMSNGLSYDYGTGGLHACTKPGVYTEEENYFIVDIDVKSLRLNLVNSVKSKFD